MTRPKITADLNVMQVTQYGYSIRWTRIDKGVYNDVLSGDLIGKKGQVLKPYVCARLFWDGRIGRVEDSRGRILDPG